MWTYSKYLANYPAAPHLLYKHSVMRSTSGIHSILFPFFLLIVHLCLFFQSLPQFFFMSFSSPSLAKFHSLSQSPTLYLCLCKLLFCSSCHQLVRGPRPFLSFSSEFLACWLSSWGLWQPASRTPNFHMLSEVVVHFSLSLLHFSYVLQFSVVFSD